MTQRIYIGPAIPGVVKKGAVFIGGLPKRLNEVAAKVPAIQNLVVPINEITEKRKAISEQGSIENVSYGRVEQYLLKGEK